MQGTGIFFKVSTVMSVLHLDVSREHSLAHKLLGLSYKSLLARKTPRRFCEKRPTLYIVDFSVNIYKVPVVPLAFNRKVRSFMTELIDFS